MHRTRSYRDWLRLVAPLSDCSARELDAIAAATDVQRVDAGAVLCGRGHRWRGRIVVVAGRVIARERSGVATGTEGSCIVAGDATIVIAVTPATVLLFGTREWNALEA